MKLRLMKLCKEMLRRINISHMTSVTLLLNLNLRRTNSLSSARLVRYRHLHLSRLSNCSESKMHCLMVAICPNRPISMKNSSTSKNITKMMTIKWTKMTVFRSIREAAARCHPSPWSLSAMDLPWERRHRSYPPAQRRARAQSRTCRARAHLPS